MNKTVQYAKKIYFLQDHMFISRVHVLDGYVCVPSGRNEKYMKMIYQYCVSGLKKAQNKERLPLIYTIYLVLFILILVGRGGSVG